MHKLTNIHIVHICHIHTYTFNYLDLLINICLCFLIHFTGHGFLLNILCLVLCFFFFACQVTKEGYTCTSSPLRDRDTAPCLRGVLAPKNLTQAFDKDDMSYTSPNTQSGGLKRTHSVVDNGHISHETKKMRLQNVESDRDKFLFKHPNSMSSCLDQTNQTLVHIFDL